MRKELLNVVAFTIMATFFAVMNVSAQTYNHSAANQTTCSGTFYDQNGTLNYLNSQTVTQTFFPATAGSKLRFTFTSFATEDEYDGLVIYNGNSTAAPIISSGLPVGINTTTAPAGSFYGNVSPGIITSTATDGSLTFVFRSDEATRAAGWVATIQCISNEITTNAGSYGPFCNTAANNITLTYSAIGTYTGNFRIQYSNAAGVFPANTTANLLATASSGTGSITAVVPAGIPVGSGYRVRVVNTAPATISTSNNGSDIVVNAGASVVASPASSTICQGGIQTLTATGGNIGASATSVLGNGGTTSAASSATNTIGPNPFQNYYGGSKQQMLIRAAELNTLGLSANGSQITSLGIYMAAVSATALQNVTVKMQNTATAALSTAVVSTGWTTVYTNASLTPTTGLNALALTTPFSWNGTDNLLIEINYSNANSPSSGPNTATYDATAYVSTNLYRVDNQSAATLNNYAGTATYAYSQRNRLQFSYKNVGTGSATWTPVTGLYTDAAATVAYTANAQAATVYAKPASTTTYTASVSNLNCNATSQALVTVNAPSVAGSVSANQTICTGTQPATITIGTSTGTIQWQSSLDNVTFTNISGATANTLSGATIGNLNVTRYFRAVVTNAPCAAVNSGVVTVNISPATVGGTVSGAATVCSGANTGTLNLANQTGSVVRWESSTDGFATANPISNTTTSLTYTNLVLTTAYRAVVKSGACNEATSTEVIISVNAGSVGGTLASDATVCSGTNSGTITLSGQTGDVLRWESSTNNFTTVTSIANTTNSQSYTNLTATTAYRAVVQSGVCAAVNSTVATITVNPVSAGGAVDASATVCSGTNSGTLNLNGQVGNILRWESSTNNFATITTIANTTTTQAYSNLTATTSYRAVVQSGVCAAANSTVATITVNPVSAGGAVDASATVCSGTNSGTLTLSGQVGNVIRWESSTNGFATVTNIANTTTTQAYSNLTATTSYRAVVQSGLCAAATSTVATITVNTAATAGTLAGGGQTCYGNNSGTLTLTGQTGTIIGWESSFNNFLTAATPIDNTTNTLSYTNLTNTTYYRVVVSGGACGIVYSNVVAVTVNINFIWTGAVDTAWENAGNWSCGAVPTSDTNVSITTVPNQPVIGADAFAKTLTLEPGTTLLLQSGNDLRVTDVIYGLGNSLFTIENNANLIQELDVDNIGAALVKRNTNPLMRLDYTLWSSPVTGAQTLLNFSPLTAVARFYTYNPTTDLYNVTPPAGTWAEGTGYLIRTPNNHPATTPTIWEGKFSGTLNNGTLDLPVTPGTYNAIGNPYPSTIDADQFIIDNGINEALYFWRKTNNTLTTSYATYTLAGGAGTSTNPVDPLALLPNGVIQVGQGFIAKATSNTFHFDNTMRIGNNNNQFFRQNQVERNRMWINLTSATGIFSQTMVAYMTGATYGVDAAIDGPYFNDSTVALTSLINGGEYAVQGRSLPFEPTDVVPMGFKVIDGGAYSIGLDHVDGFWTDATQPIYVRDNAMGIEHDLRSGAYSFDTEGGVFNDRFEIVYQTTLSTAVKTIAANNVVVYKNNQDIVINTGKVKMANVKVYDIRGRLVVEKDQVNSSDLRIFAGTTNQVFIVKITDADQNVVSKKVVN